MFDSHSINALGWTLVHFLWQGSAIVFLYWLISRSSKSLHAKYWTGMSAVMLCLVIPASQFLSLIQTTDVVEGLFTINNFSHSMALKPVSSLDTLMMLINQSLPLLVLVWAVVVLSLTAGLFRSWHKLNAIEHECDNSLSAELKQFIKKTAIKLDLATIPVLKVSKKVLVPAAYGIYKPTVLLPLSLMSQIPKEQVHAIITHELCHLKRNDFLHNIIQLTIDVLLFFHPLVRWMNNDIRQIREQCCDQLVLSQDTHAITYAKALTNIASLTSGHSFGPKLQIGINDGLLLKRVKFLLQKNSSQSSIMMFLPLGILILACIYLFQTNQTPIGVIEASQITQQTETNEIKKRLVSNLFYPQPLSNNNDKTAVSLTEKNHNNQETLPAATTPPVSPSLYPKSKQVLDMSPQLMTISNKAEASDIELRAELKETFKSETKIEVLSDSPVTSLNNDFENSTTAITNISSQTTKPATTELIKPQLKVYLAPEYPVQCWQRQLEQTVIASFKIKPNGRLYEIDMKSQGNNYIAFEQSVKKTLRKWRFEKSSLNASSLNQTYQQIFEFKLSQKLQKNCEQTFTGSRMKKATACNQ